MPMTAAEARQSLAAMRARAGTPEPPAPPPPPIVEAPRLVAPTVQPYTLLRLFGPAGIPFEECVAAIDVRPRRVTFWMR